MKTICVGGTASNCGKTSVTCLLLRSLPGWAAVKVTPCHREEVCPRSHDCGACCAPRYGYETVTDLESLGRAGKDTARFIGAGAEKVVWVRTLPEFLPAALESALSRVAGAQGVVVESTSAIPLLDGLHIVVTNPGQQTVKKSAVDSASLVDLVAVNFRQGEDLGKPLPAIQTDVPRVPVCAVLPPEHPANNRFVADCRSRVTG